MKRNWSFWNFWLLYRLVKQLIYWKKTQTWVRKSNAFATPPHTWIHSNMETNIFLLLLTEYWQFWFAVANIVKEFCLVAQLWEHENTLIAVICPWWNSVKDSEACMLIAKIKLCSSARDTRSWKYTFMAFIHFKIQFCWKTTEYSA